MVIPVRVVNISHIFNADSLCMVEQKVELPKREVDGASFDREPLRLQYPAV
jgi:hypothetical protein